MSISVSSFRSDIYNMLDDVVKTGRPLELDRKGTRLAIVPLAAKRKLDNLVKHSVIVGDPQDLAALDWTRDPFDRIIVANAIVNDAVLITKDTRILKNYLKARW